MYKDTIKEGDAYYKLKKCIVINILDFELINETKRYHTKFKIKEVEEGFELLDDLEINYIELSKFNSEKNIESMTDLEEWITFLKDAGKKEKEEKIKKIVENKQQEIQKGIKEEKYMIVKRLLIKGQDIDTIIDITQLTKEEVEKIVKEIKK